MRPRSALLDIEELPAEKTNAGPVQLRRDIYQSLTATDITKDELTGIESASRTKWFIVFEEEETRDRHIRKEIEVYGQTFKLQDPNPPPQQRYTHVKVYGFPLDEDDDDLENAMSYYGDLSHITDMMDRTLDLKTGVKDLAYTTLTENIPSYIWVGKHQLQTSYTGQIKTCRKCHQPGHIGRDCTAGKVCRACGDPSHSKNACPHQRCYQCQETGHLQKDCTRKRTKIDVTEIPEGSENDGDNEDSNATNENNETENEAEEIPTETTPQQENEPMNVEKPDLKRPRTPEKDSDKPEEETYLVDMVTQRRQRTKEKEMDTSTTQAKKRTKPPPVSMGKNRNPWTK